ncbi:predicted protein [Thalassiosira pseudonana CCMP1335]|uniref:Mitochondrial cardiolipin hydrolase n=1 Tax=Thalassiosira pseudonana TaxID=35128 RepID=B8C630_THAPS|nr:predicted protein [Thalassiosira pseudonana CCMP1335]EED91221.1 predicted protein [Thalassiosira pseudonana CCMP1335]
MRVKADNKVLSCHAISGTRVVLLAMDINGFSLPESTDDSSLSELMSEVNLSSDDGRNCRVTRATSKKGNGMITTTSVIKGNSSRVQCIGFSISRRDVETNESFSLNVDGKPIQKLLWGDYEVLPGKTYEYTIRRVIKSSRINSFVSKFVGVESPLQVTVATEDPSNGVHGVYFNRGAAGSRAFSEKFGEYKKWHLSSKFGAPRWKSIIDPRSIPCPDRSSEALAWLSRGLEEALIAFLSQATSGDQLRATVYEFTHPETLREFASAVERGVDVKIIRHCKGSYHSKVKRGAIVRDKNGKVEKEWVPDTTTDSAKKAIDKHDTFIERKHSSGLMHNKFIIILKKNKPVGVWTGSTNFTDGGIYGQSNVGHIVRDTDVATRYLKYWNALMQDPPGRRRSGSLSGDDVGNDEGINGVNENDPMDVFNEAEQPDIEVPLSSPSMHVIFSPRKTTNMLQLYADVMQNATRCVHFTAAFGVKPSEKSSAKFRASAEKKGSDYVDYFDFKSATENRIAYGTILSDDGMPPGEETETTESLTGFTTFVDFIHTKYMLVDALTESPTVITGSANFSEASTNRNDENMMVIKGNTTVADIYLTEFMRLFDHFYSRDEHNNMKSSQAWAETVDDESWLHPYYDPSTQLYHERLLFR